MEKHYTEFCQKILPFHQNSQEALIFEFWVNLTHFVTKSDTPVDISVLVCHRFYYVCFLFFYWNNLISYIFHNLISFFSLIPEQKVSVIPSIYQKNVYDVSGFAVAAVEKAKILPLTESIQPGDVVIGLPSSGIHSNGFSLVRRVLDMNKLRYDQPSPVSTNSTIGEMSFCSTSNRQQFQYIFHGNSYHIQHF